MQMLAEMQITTKEISIINHDLPAGKFSVDPHFVRATNKDGNIGQTELTMEILNTPEHPFPMDIRVTMLGRFNMQQIPEAQHDSFLEITAVQIMFPYLRTLLSSITTSALMPPIVFPVVDVRSLFKDSAGIPAEEKPAKKKASKKKAKAE